MIDEFSSKNRRIIAELVRGLRSAQSQGDMTGTNLGAIGVSQMPNGTFYDFDPPATGVFEFYGVLVSKGPNGEDDFTDARYYVRPVMVTQATGSDAKGLPTLRINTSGIWVVASSLQEVAVGSHSLPVYSGDAEIDLTDSSVTIVYVSQIEGVATGITQGFPFTQDNPTASNPVPGNTLYVFTASSIADKGLHQGDIHQMMTDEEAGWGPAQFGP